MHPRLIYLRQCASLYAIDQSDRRWYVVPLYRCTAIASGFTVMFLSLATAAQYQTVGSFVFLLVVIDKPFYDCSPRSAAVLCPFECRTLNVRFKLLSDQVCTCFSVYPPLCT